MKAILLGLLLLAALPALAQVCPTVDEDDQKAAEKECKASGGAWGRYGVRAHLCHIYTCAERTKDAGKACASRSHCEHLCVTEAPARLGAEATGRCTAIKTTFGCYTYVEGGRIAGRVCVD